MISSPGLLYQLTKDHTSEMLEFSIVKNFVMYLGPANQERAQVKKNAVIDTIEGLRTRIFPGLVRLGEICFRFLPMPNLNQFKWSIQEKSCRPIARLTRGELANSHKFKPFSLRFIDSQIALTELKRRNIFEELREDLINLAQDFPMESIFKLCVEILSEQWKRCAHFESLHARLLDCCYSCISQFEGFREFLLRVGNENVYKLLFLLIQDGRVSQVRYLLDSLLLHFEIFKNSSFDNRSDFLGVCLAMAMFKGDPAIVDLILEKQPNIHVTHAGKTPLELAECYGHDSIATKLRSVSFFN